MVHYFPLDNSNDEKTPSNFNPRSVSFSIFYKWTLLLSNCCSNDKMVFVCSVFCVSFFFFFYYVCFCCFIVIIMRSIHMKRVENCCQNGEMSFSKEGDVCCDDDDNDDWEWTDRD